LLLPDFYMLTASPVGGVIIRYSENPTLCFANSALSSLSTAVSGMDAPGIPICLSITAFFGRINSPQIGDATDWLQKRSEPVVGVYCVYGNTTSQRPQSGAYAKYNLSWRQTCTGRPATPHERALSGCRRVRSDADKMPSKRSPQRLVLLQGLRGLSF